MSSDRLQTRYSKNKLSRSRRGPSRPATCSYWGTKNVSTRPGSKTEVAQPEWYVGSALNSGHAATASACRFRVESRCDAVALGSNISVSAPFVWRCLTGSTMAPFSHPAHRTRTCRFPAVIRTRHAGHPHSSGTDNERGRTWWPDRVRAHRAPPGDQSPRPARLRPVAQRHAVGSRQATPRVAQILAQGVELRLASFRSFRAEPS